MIAVFRFVLGGSLLWATLSGCGGRATVAGEQDTTSNTSGGSTSSSSGGASYGSQPRATGGDSPEVAGAGGEASGGSAGVPSDPAENPPPLPPPEGTFQPDACVEFDIDIAVGCDTCPADPVRCECPNGFSLLPETPCIFGRCVASADCDRLCLNSMDFGQEFGADVAAVDECLRALTTCSSDADCGDGKCLGEGDAHVSICNGGLEGNSCLEPADCQDDMFCALSPYGMCSRGQPGAACNTDEQCVDSTCIGYRMVVDEQIGTVVAVGACSAGADGHPCASDDDCTAPNYCVGTGSGELGTMGGEPRLGLCATGDLDAPCESGDQCESGFCFAPDLMYGIPGKCRPGGFRDPCLDGGDCESGYCSRQQDNISGTCVPGTFLSPCFLDDACETGHCAVNNFSNEGVCTGGNAGEPCQDGTECLSGLCLEPAKGQSPDCTAVGDRCNGDGVCGGEAICFTGKCG